MSKQKVKKKKTLDKAEEVCSRLAKWRHKIGIPQREAAERLGINIRTYQNWEQLRRKPTGLALAALSQIIAK